MAHLSNIEGIEMEGKLPEVRLASTPFKSGVLRMSRRAISRRPSRSWSTGVQGGLALSEPAGRLPVPARRSPWRTSSSRPSVRRWCSRTIKRWPHSSAPSCANFFPENAVEYFVSYYDYYQPEAYVPSTDTYIAKDASTNDEIDKLRLSATAALCERKDVIVVSSVSCIYGLGAPQEFFDMMISLRPGMEKDRDEVIKQLIDIQYTRNEMDFHRGTFRVRGDVLEIFPANSTDRAVRVEFFGDEIERITDIDVLTGEIKSVESHAAIFPASHYVVPQEQIRRAADAILEEMKQQVGYFKSEDKLIEAQRIAERTNFDVEMMKETGFCSGIENYSRHLTGLAPGQPPYTLMDYFGDVFFTYYR